MRRDAVILFYFISNTSTRTINEKTAIVFRKKGIHWPRG